MAKCKVCGSRVPDGVSECPMCGAKISVSQSVSVQENQSTPVKEKAVQPQESAPVEPAPKSSASAPIPTHTQAKCKVCGSRIPDGATACPMCGAKLKVSESAESTVSPVQKPVPVQSQENQKPQSEYQPQPVPVQPSSPVIPPPKQPSVEPHKPESSSSPNQSEIAAAVSYVMAQNTKIRIASDRIMDTNTLMDEMTTSKNKKDNGFAFMASRIRKNAGMAKAWENVVADIETTKSYIYKHQYEDSTYKNAVEDFIQSTNIAINAMEKIRKNCLIGVIGYPIATVISVIIMLYLLYELKQIGMLIDIGILCMLIFIFVDFIVLINQKNKINSFISRIKR